ncbi:MAG: hypothetical protein K6B43_03440 [Treponema sp.]|nr:hypothetical protein [Treponema sp.]
MKHGMPKLCELIEFVRNCIGDEALLEIKAKEINQFNESDRERLLKEWNRLCKESSASYEIYSLNENDIFRLAHIFFAELQEKYSFPEVIAKSIFCFCNNFYSEMKKEKTSGLFGELQTQKYALLSINQTMNLILLPEYCKKNGLNATQKSIGDSLKKDFSYRRLFDELLQKTNLPSITKYIEGLESTFDSENAGEKTFSFRDTVEAAYKKNKNPTWKRFCFILKYCPTELQKDFVLTYLLNNIKTSFEKHFELSKENFLNIKNDLLSFADGKATPQELSEKIRSVYPQDYSDNVRVLISFFKKTFEDFEYKKIGLQEYYRSLETIEKITPYTSKFFVPWLKGFVCVAQDDFETARTWFKQSFDNYQYAGDYLGVFLKMVFSFENYFTKWENVRKSISEDENKTPVNKYAKMYWNFGYAIGLFDKKADDVYLEAYKPIQNFYGYFPTKCFFDEEKAKTRHSKEFMSEMGMHGSTYENEEDLHEHLIEKPYKVLSSLKTSSQRNKLISFWKVYDEYNPENEIQPRMYTPLALCMQLGTYDERLWDLANEWLDDKENPVDVDKICFNGSAALHEALTQYSHIRLNSIEITEKLKKLRAVTSKIIDRATYIGETKRETQISPLQKAIDSYDVDFVKRIADKISDDGFQNYLISADEQTPLYYVLSRRDPLIRGFDKLDEVRNQPQNKNNYVWKNLAVHGYTENEKRDSLDSMLEGTSDFAKIVQSCQKEFYNIFYGHQTTKDAQLKAFDDIIDYFISRTKNVDSFEKIHKDGQGCNALLYAAEFDDVSTCRKLINAGADISKVLGLVPAFFNQQRNRVKMPNAFVFRCIYYESWNTLRMFLTEFKDKAATVMHRGDFEVTPLVAFIITIQNKFAAISPFQLGQATELLQIAEEFTDLFVEAGSDMTESTELGCAEFLLTRR